MVSSKGNLQNAGCVDRWGMFMRVDVVVFQVELWDVLRFSKTSKSCGLKTNLRTYAECCSWEAIGEPRKIKKQSKSIKIMDQLPGVTSQTG